jgi:short-subunit dehydrogenase
MGPHNVSKAGVLSLSETLAAELSGSGVKVTVLCPTFVKTNILEAGAGRISEESSNLAHKLMRWTGFSAEKVARMCLDAHDRGELYCLPQLDAKVGWNIKRLAPQAYTRGAGLISRAAGNQRAPTKGAHGGHRNGSHARQDQGSPMGAR